MKKILSVISVLFFFLLILPLKTSAEEIIVSGTCGENLTWTLDAEGSLTISGSGEMDDYFYYRKAPWVSWQDQIKTVVIESGVTGIGDDAFKDCTALTGVTISNSVTRIGDEAFGGCAALTDIVIPDSVTSIDEYAFSECTSLLSVKMSKHVAVIPRAAFSGCTMLTNIILPENLTNIASSAFYECASLTAITISKNVTSVGRAAFYGCTALEKVTIPGCLVSIDQYAFDACTNLTSVTYCGTPEQWELIRVAANNDVLGHASRQYHDYQGVSCMSARTCCLCGKASAAASDHSWVAATCSRPKTCIGCNLSEGKPLGHSVTGSACSRCGIPGGTCGGNLNWVLDEMGNMTIFGSGTMFDYSYLAYKSAPWYSMRNQVRKVVIEPGVTSIGEYAFHSCNALTDITIADSVVSIGERAFCYCYALTDITIPEGITAIEGRTFYMCTKLVQVDLPDSLTTIGQEAFYSCANLTQIILPGSVTKIGEGAFAGCAKLTQIQIPAGVEGEADGWFAGCTSLKEVLLPAKIQRVSETFKDCTSLESVYIPAGVRYIGFTTFDGCTSLMQLQIDPDNANYCYENGAIFNKDKTELSQVLEWNSGIYTVADSVRTVSLYAFTGCDQLTQIHLPENLRIIEQYAFEGCTGLQNLVIQNGVQTIENNAFENCMSLQEIEIPESVKTIGYAAFKNCKALKSLVLPAGLEIIKKELFYGCESLRQLVIPEHVVYFEESVFYGTHALEQVFFLGDEPSSAESLFYEYLESYQDVTAYHLISAEGWQGDTWSGAALETWGYILSGTASCTQAGTQTFTDAEHGLVYSRTTADVAHCWEKPIIGKAPTTEEEGFWIRTCTACGKQELTGTIPKYAATEQVPAAWNNASKQNYGVRSDVVNSYLEPAEDGGFIRIQNHPYGDHITVERYDKDFHFLSRLGITLELPIFGGYYNDGTYRYLVVGQTNYDEDNSKEVIRVIRYSQDWMQIDSASLCGANTTIPFDAGSVRMDHSGNILYIRSCHEMYTSGDGKNHQANITLTVHIPTMRITTAEVLVAHNPSGYVSHSFNQFIQTDGQDLVAVDHGDAYPRSIVLHRNQGTAGKYLTTGDSEDVNVLELYGKTGENSTGASVGGFEISDSAYLIAGNSIDQDGSVSYYGQRNIFVSATSKENFTEEGTSITWLTNYANGTGKTVSTPHLVKVDGDTFAVLWTEADGYQSTPELKLAYVNQYGKWDGQIYTAEGELSDCKPIVVDNRILWYTAYVTWSDYPDWTPEFYEIRLDDPTKILAHHRFTTWVSEAPTAQTTGTLTITCQNDCHSWSEVTMPALREEDYICDVTGQLDCTTSGKVTYTWRDTTYGTVSWEVELGGRDHSWVAATCTTPKTCSVCNATQGEPMGHNWKEADCTAPKTCTVCKETAGNLGSHIYTDGVDGTCNVCGIHRETTENRTVMHMFRMYDPNSGEHFYTGSEVERQNLIDAGWNYEGVGFTFSRTTGLPVYRLYDPATGEHLYTMDEKEKAQLMAQGWNFEGIAFNSAYDTEVPQYRLHNPNATRGAYHFTASIEERDFLISLGWEDQGIGFYSSWK